MAPPRPAKIRLYTVAFATIILAMVLIGLLALNMVRSQQKVRRLELEEAASRVLRERAGEIVAAIGKLEDAVFAKVSASLSPALDSPLDSDGLRRAALEHPLVSYPFLLTASGRRLFPPPAERPRKQVTTLLERWWPPAPDRRWAEAEKVELEGENSLGALQLYLALPDREPGKRRALLHSAIGRCYLKLGMNAQAADYFSTALAELGPSDPFRFFLMRQAGIAWHRAENSPAAFASYLTLYEEINRSSPGQERPELEWLRGEALDFLKNQAMVQTLPEPRQEEIEAMLRKYPGLPLDEAAELEIGQEARDDRDARRRFLKAREILDPGAMDTLFYRRVEKLAPSMRLAPSGKALRHLSGSFQRLPFVVCFGRLGGVGDGSIFGFRLDDEYLQTSLLSGYLRAKGLAPGLGLAVASPEKRIAGGEASSPRRIVLDSASLDPVLPGWTLQLEAATPQFFARLAASGLRWYYALIAALAAAVLLGIFLFTRFLAAERRALSRQAAFVDLASHTLKTPITRLHLLAERLQGKGAGHADEAERLCRAITAETEAISHLVDRLLFFSSLRGRDPGCRLGWHDPVLLLEEVKLKFAPLADEKRINLESGVEGAARGASIDREGLQVALSNLAENAIHYAGLGGYLGFFLFFLPDRLVFEVRDHGPGISEEERSRIFSPFFRGAESRRHSAPGSGLGLAIAHEIARTHGGSLELVSPAAGPAGEGAGCIFRLTIPAVGECPEE